MFSCTENVKMTGLFNMFNSSPPYKMATILPKAFSLMKMMYKFQFEFHWSLLSIPKGSIGSGNGLAPNRHQANTCTNADPVNSLVTQFTGNKPIHVLETMLNQFTGVHMQHQGDELTQWVFFFFLFFLLFLFFCVFFFFTTKWILPRRTTSTWSNAICVITTVMDQVSGFWNADAWCYGTSTSASIPDTWPCSQS